jgi:uncharacterized protein YndB with AHSA1/START domain
MQPTVVVADDGREEERELPADALFILIGGQPLTAGVEGWLRRDERGLSDDRARPPRGRSARPLVAARARSHVPRVQRTGCLRRRRRPARLDQARRIGSRGRGDGDRAHPSIPLRPTERRTVRVIRFETSVRIEQPVDEVFAYVSEPENFPRWNSAVQTVRKTSFGEDPVGLTYSMTRQLPSGQAENDLEITAYERPREFAIRTLSGPTPFAYRYAFSPSDGGHSLSSTPRSNCPAPLRWWDRLRDAQSKGAWTTTSPG